VTRITVRDRGGKVTTSDGRARAVSYRVGGRGRRGASCAWRGSAVLLFFTSAGLSILRSCGSCKSDTEMEGWVVPEVGGQKAGWWTCLFSCHSKCRYARRARTNFLALEPLTSEGWCGRDE
jgi:hypothetical protein